MDSNFTLILLAIVLAAFIFFQYRSSKRRQKQAAERLATLLPGVEVMTNFGLYGKLVSMDDEDNTALVEIAPKTVIKLHRQVILKAVDPVVPDADADSSPDAAPEINVDHAQPLPDPEYGERTTGAKKSSRKKPASDSE